jgi:hypothetical protein
MINNFSLIFVEFGWGLSEMSEEDIIRVAEQGEHVQKLMKETFPHKTGMILKL